MDSTNTEPRGAEPFLGASQTRLFAAIFAVLLVLLVGWYFLVLRQDYAVLYSDLRPQEAASIVDALEKQGLSYRIGAGGSEIRVPASKLDTVRLQLASSDAPLGRLDGFELFNDSDMGLTDFAQKIRYQRALQGELARTIMRMEGVAEARVHISMPERTLFRGERRKAEAAVTLVMRTPRDETPARIEGVQRLVAAAAPDLLVSDVVVLNARGEVISPRVEISEALTRGRQGAATHATGPSIDLVMEIMRRALPNRRFEVTIEPSTAALEGGAGGEASPAQRVVTVLTESPLRAFEMESVSSALRGGGIIDGQSGGTLTFRVGPPSMFEALPAAVISGSADALSSQASGFTLTQALPWAGLMLLVLLSAAGLGAWAWLSKPKLAPEEHARFADELKAALRAQGGQSA